MRKLFFPMVKRGLFWLLEEWSVPLIYLYGLDLDLVQKLIRATLFHFQDKSEWLESHVESCEGACTCNKYSILHSAPVCILPHCPFRWE